MNTSVVLGRYIPLDSPVHRMDPRAKIVAMFAFLIALFIDTGFIGYAILGAVVFTGVLAAKLKPSYIWRAFKPMLVMMVFLMILNFWAIRTGYVLFSIFGWKIYSDAVFQTLYIVLRLLLMINATTLVTATTKPMDMTIAIEDLLTPLKKIGFPAHDVAMMISIALRFIPTLLEESQRIMKAQASRGVDMEEGKFMEKIMAILSLIVPLFVSSYQKADDLANAMEARGYDPDAKRVRYRTLTMRMSDWMLVIGMNLVLAGIICLKVFL
ncbi:MAG: energy-coupling factor transporter transmembrane protein EcfT [Erysipelotrichales bacterium]|nr:energy-coupling factor transporter transmembrane protein EcfT [Erysipelotrichales bacterium]MBQ1385807.1 energy-coupling factor transporter transmembrane protein EcfT [Erysipelotrichales bacterium]MBQ4011555.1 energy-coupling factor transporter transmembrane protein EcfT [Erysipelotrichales bacterium]